MSKTKQKTMTKSVKTYPGKYREIWEEFREFPGKNIAISREFPDREIPAVNPRYDLYLFFNYKALDVMRALTKSKGEALRVFRKRILKAIQDASKSTDPNITASSYNLELAVRNLIDFCSQMQENIVAMEYAGKYNIY